MEARTTRAALALAGAAVLSLVLAPAASAADINATDTNFFSPRFEPFEVTAAPGDVVSVHGTGSDRHTLTSVDGKWPEVDVQKDETKTFTAPATPGDYRFYCRYHASPAAKPGEGMAGVLHVQGKSPAVAPPPQPTPGAEAALVILGASVLALVQRRAIVR